MTGIFLFSCDKYKGTDVYITGDALVYAASGNQGYNVLNGASMSVFRNTVLSETSVAFPAALTRPVDKDVQVTASIDTGLVKVYDSIFQPATPSPSLPYALFKLNAGMVTIKAGETVSADSFYLKQGDFSKVLGGTNTYIVPVVLQTTDKNIPVSATRQVMYTKIQVSATAAGIAGLNNAAVTDNIIEKAGNVFKGADMVYLKGVLNRSAPEDVSIKVMDNAAYINDFNKKNGTAYEAFPEGAYQLVKNSVTVPAGKTTSKDSIAVKLTNLSVFQKDKEYLLPLEIVNDNNAASLPIDVSRKIAYIHISIFENNVDASNSDPSGTVMNRSGWSVTASGSFSGNGISRILDGNNSTAWDSDGKLPAWIQLNMGTSQTVKGFRIVPSYEYTGDNFINMEVYSGNDGAIWKLEGKYVGTVTGSSSSATNPDIKVVRFITPVTARYFKFNITKTTDGRYAGMGELNGVE
ncbi:DUF1735 domain-containing protein [Niabella sp.]|uniref:BT_3987 domain-containing protein n=1 Tax=Niabella sp. TaxID=1962976 RepID=UPI00262FD0AD|nr:DUF1735 domain-containing protein [Niabella sp.]